MGWIGVDLDGTLAEYHGWHDDGRIGKPILPMVARVKKWLAEGKEVRIVTERVWPLGTNGSIKLPSYSVLWATRPSWIQRAQEQMKQVQAWSQKIFGRILPVTCVKDLEMVELWDDRAVAVECNTGRYLGGNVDDDESMPVVPDEGGPMYINSDIAQDLGERLPEEIQWLCRLHGPLIVVAGGYVRDLLSDAEPHDIDIFAVSSWVMDRAIGDYRYHMFKKATVTTTSNATTFYQDNGLIVQFVRRVYYPDHDALIRSFDFSICQCALYWDNGQWIGITTEEFWPDLMSKTMRYTAPERDEDPGASVIRMVKFASRGYTISRDDIAKVVGRFDAQMHGEPEAVGVERVRKAFSKIGYAGRQSE